MSERSIERPEPASSEGVERQPQGDEFYGEMGERETGDTGFSGELGEREHEGRENVSRESLEGEREGSIE